MQKFFAGRKQGRGVGEQPGRPNSGAQKQLTAIALKIYGNFNAALILHC
jgi:hypothetical protein